MSITLLVLVLGQAFKGFLVYKIRSNLYLALSGEITTDELDYLKYKWLFKFKKFNTQIKSEPLKRIIEIHNKYWTVLLFILSVTLIVEIIEIIVKTR